jgi:DNA invertase Pin-like site-specific DNA recombinase
MVGQRIGYVRVSTLDKTRQANSRRYLPAVPSQPQGFPCRVVHGTSANLFGRSFANSRAFGQRRHRLTTLGHGVTV